MTAIAKFEKVKREKQIEEENEKQRNKKNRSLLPWSVEFDDNEIVFGNGFVEVGVIETKYESLQFAIGS